MAFDFEALVGHLYVVGGRALNTSPPGLLVQVAPRKAARGREMDTFFTLVLPSGTGPVQARFYEQMAQRAAEEYFNSSGSVTSGIRSVFGKLNNNLYQHNQSGASPFEAYMIIAILHGNDVFLAQVGGGVALMRVQESLHVFPGSFDHDETLFGPPLGVQPVADIKMTHYRLSSGTRLVLADGSLADFEMAAMEQALAKDNMGNTLLAFKGMETQSLTMLLVEFVPPGAPDDVAVQIALSTNGALPEEAPEPVPAAPVTNTGRSQRVQQTAGTAALKLADRVDGVTKIVDRISSNEGPGRFNKLANNSSIVLLPVALVVMVLIMWLTGTGESEFETCVSDAKNAATLARGIASSDVQGLLAAWNAALLTVERCGELRPGAEPDPEIQAIQREGQTIVDQLNYIERRETRPIEAFPNASLSSLVLRGDDLYVLDEGNQQVYRVTLSDDGLSMVPNTRQPVATMRRGAAVGAFTVGRLIDISWFEDGAGLSQGNVLVALDEEGVLVEYSPTFLARGVQRLLGSDQWVNPIKIQSWRGRLYLLDPGADQIWRYDPTGGAFPGTPLEYFVGARRPSLEGAVDFAIDDSGRVYVLFSDGIIAVFRSSEEVSFGWASFPPNMELQSPNNMFLDTNPLAQTIYINDRANRTIFVTSMAGTFNTSYRSFDESFFDLLSDIVVDENRRIIYVTSGNSILALPR